MNKKNYKIIMEALSSGMLGNMEFPTALVDSRKLTIKEIKQIIKEEIVKVSGVGFEDLDGGFAKTITCRICGKEFDNYSELYDHLEKEHKDDDWGKSELSDRKEWKQVLDLAEWFSVTNNK